MLQVKEVQSIVNQYIENIDWGISPQGLYDPIAYVLGLGGKRIRPVLSILSANLFTSDITSVVTPAIGLEIFHNFSLLHDDIMDHAEMRRNKPTVHMKWNENTAILSGDAMLIKVYQHIAETPSYCLSEVFSVFSKTALEVCEGQQYDMEFELRENVSESEYLEMIRLKTAVLLGASLQIGALIGKANEKDAQLLYDFGINVGLAFQLKDDLLDVYGEAETFGKNIGGDILCNKKTYLLLQALERATGDTKIELQEWLNKKDYIASKKIAAVTEIYNQLGIKSLCEEKINAFFSLAIQCLDKVQVSLVKKDILRDLAEELMYRQV